MPALLVLTLFSCARPPEAPPAGGASPTARALAVPAGQGLNATYFANTDFTGAQTSRVDAQIDFNWQRTEPVTGVGDAWSARWTGDVIAPTTGTYTVIATTDDGVRVWVGGTRVINDWTAHAAKENRATVNLTAGVRTPLKVEFYDGGGNAVAKLEWVRPDGVRQVVPTTALFTPAAPASSCGPTFSADLAPYPAHPSAATLTAEQIVARLAHPAETLSADLAAKRLDIARMYRALGYDLSLDASSWYSNTLAGLRPKTFSAQTRAPLGGAYPAPYSIDAPYYQPIPCDSARVELPAGYFKWAQLHTVKGFDGVGYGVCLARPEDATVTVVSEVDRQYKAPFVQRVRPDWVAACQPENANADRAVQFVDPVDQSVVDCMGARFVSAREVSCTFAVRVRLGTLGDRQGTIASGHDTLPGLVRAGEATNKDKPIEHAIFFNTNRMWRARVYPAVSGDAFLYNNGGNAQYTGGLIPYGAVVQLDPTLDLGKLGLSLPARRILEAMQKYGAYNVNTGGPDFGIYTSANASEFDAHGGIYRPDTKQGVQDQIGRVLSQSRLYVVPPLVKR